MEDANYHQDHDMNNDNDTNEEYHYKIDEEDSDDEDVDFEFNLDIFQRLKQNDPSITNMNMTLNYDRHGKSHFSSIDWKEDGDCISSNTQLKEIFMCYSDSHYGEKISKLPSRQQIQDVFSCMYRNRSINNFGTHTIIDEEFSGSLIEGLCGHPSIEILVIGHSKIGGIVFSALGKVLKHPGSKVKVLRLPYCQLDDEGLDIMCDALVGNSTLKRLSLSNNKHFTPLGWKTLSNVIRHSKSKLVQLDLFSTLINEDAANLLGSALRVSSIKALNLGHNKSMSKEGCQTLLNYLSQTSVEHLDLFYNNIDDAGLAVLVNIWGTLKSLGMGRNQLITPTGWQSFFNSLQTRATRLKNLDISHTTIDSEGITALGSLTAKA